MAKNLQYDEKIAGAKLVANKTGGWTNLTELPSGDIVYWVNAGDTFYCTGYYYTSNGLTFVQTTNGRYVAMDLSAADATARWTFYEPSSGVTLREQQEVVNKIVSNDFKIVQNNLLCARFAHYLTEDEKQLVRDLQHRVEARNYLLKEQQPYTDYFEEGYPSGYAQLSPYLDKLMNEKSKTGVGVVISTWVIVVVAFVLVALLTSTVYLACKNYANESAQDVKFSDDLTKKLTDKLTEEEYQQLLDETEGIVTKARVRQSVSTFWNTLGTSAKVIIGLAAAFLGYSWYKKNKGL